MLSVANVKLALNCYCQHFSDIQMIWDGYLPNAPPISAPLVGMFTLTMPQSDPLAL